MFEELHKQSESEFRSEDDFSNWANKVDPLIEKASTYYIIEFRAIRSDPYYDPKSGTHKPKIKLMLDVFQKAYNKIKLESDLENNKYNQEYYPKNSQYSIQKKVSEILSEAKHAIWIYDSHMDETIIKELENTDCNEVELLTTYPKSNLYQRFEGFKKQFPKRNIEIKIDPTSHDRFYIIDKKHVWTLGASFKDAGNKATMCYQMGKPAAIKALITDFESWWNSGTPIDKDS